MDYEVLAPEVEALVEGFDSLDGRGKLEFIKLVMEKMENGEVELDDEEVTPWDIGIGDGYECCRAILTALKEK
jgi:hypothetical protein